MFSNSVRLRSGMMALGCVLGIGLAGSAAWAQTIVVSASGPSARSYPAGKSLAAGSRIVLAPGDTLTVLDSRGTRTLRGPITTSAEAKATAANPGFSALVATQNRRRARTGAIRGTGESARPSNLWHVNVAAEGTACVVDPAAVRLWRADMQQAVTLTVRQDSGASAEVPFIVGQNAAAWPASLPIAEGRSYVLSGGGLTKPTRLRFAMLPTAPGDPAAAFAALDAKGCEAQKHVLVAALASRE